MNANTIELVLKILEVAGPIIAQVPTLGAKWIANRNEVLKMVREGREPTSEEHRRLTRELDGLMGSLKAALTTADARAVAEARAEEIDPVEEVVEEVEAAAEDAGTEE